MSAPTLAMGAGLDLPVNAVTQALAFLGRRGSGKTYGASKLAELMLVAGAQIVALDPVGSWYGLRLAGQGPGFEIPILGGLHADLPLEEGGGALIADLVIDRGLSAVLDVSQFTDKARTRFATAFAERFFQRKKAAPSAVHLFIEECQEFIPQNPQRGEERMLHEFQRMMKLGRNFGIGMSLISQRGQEVNKKALNQAECLFAFQTTGPHERKAVAGWIADKGLEGDLAQLLPKLAVGEPHVWSPQWLQISRTVRLFSKRTADVSATPEVGAAAAPARPLTPVDLEQLRVAMATQVARAEAEDPKRLQARVAQLERELAAAARVAAAPDAKAVEREVARAVCAEADRHIRYRRVLQGGVKAARARMQQTADQLAAIATSAREAVDGLDAVDAGIDESWVDSPPRAQLKKSGRILADVPIRSSAKIQPPVRHVIATPEGEVTRPQAQILGALRHLESLGISPISRANVAAWLGKTVSGSFRNDLGRLRTLGLVDYPGADELALTDLGRTAAGAPPAFASLAELHAHWLAQVSGPQADILRTLLAAGDMTRERLAEALDKTVSGSFRNDLGRLRSFGLIDYRGGHVVLTALLFPQGLR